MKHTRIFSIAAFGDSLFAGYGVEPEEGFCFQLGSALDQEGYRADILNFAVSGETSADGLKRINEVLHYRPDLVLLEFGANDYYQRVPPEALKANLTQMIARFQSEGINVMLVGIAPLQDLFGENDDPEFAHAAAPLFPKIAEDFGVSLFPNILEPYNRPEEKLEDGTHPNAAGIRSITRAILPYTIRQLYRLTFGQQTTKLSGSNNPELQ
ncbi:MAG: GDSL-type esterase/lipase family protein [Desulfovibrio sp.]